MKSSLLNNVLNYTPCTLSPERTSLRNELTAALHQFNLQLRQLNPQVPHESFVICSGSLPTQCPPVKRLLSIASIIVYYRSADYLMDPFMYHFYESIAKGYDALCFAIDAHTTCELRASVLCHMDEALEFSFVRVVREAMSILRRASSCRLESNMSRLLQVATNGLYGIEEG